MTAPLWPFGPDWSDSVRLGYAFSTEIITSRSGKEQRFALRSEPRIEMEFTALVSEFDFTSTVGFLASQHNLQVMMPNWSMPTRLSELSTIGSSVIKVDVVEEWMVVGKNFALIGGDPSLTISRVHTISAISGRNLTLGVPLDLDADDGFAVYPMWAGHLNVKLAGKMLSDRMMTVGVKFAVDPGFENLPSVPSAPLSHLGRDLFLTEPNWSTDLTNSFSTVLESVDYGNSRMAFFTPVPFNSRQTSLSYVAENRAEALTFLALYRRLLGQQGEFFMPTFTEDLRLRIDRAVGAVNIRLVGTGALDNFSDSTVYKNIAFIFEDGSIEVHTVASIWSLSDSLGDDCVITIGEGLTRAVHRDELSMVCWLPLWRMLSDEIVIQWRTDQIADIGLSMTTIESLDEET
jgi:hypothetical protein